MPPGCPITFHQLTALRLVASGNTIQQAAYDMAIATSSLRQHLKNARHKLGVSVTPEAIQVAQDAGWFEWERRDAPLVDDEFAQIHLSLFARAYLEQLDRWLASDRRDETARKGMRIALLGMQATPPEVTS